MCAMYNANDLLRRISVCKQVIQVHVNTAIDTALLDACIQQQEKGLAVVLVMSELNRPHLENNPFLLNRCLQLRKKGAALYITDTYPDTLLYVCISDYRQVSHFHGSDTIHTAEACDAVRKAVYRFNALVRNSLPFHVPTDGIRITLDVSEDLVLRDSYVNLTWQVYGADTVIIEGLGEVEHAGQRQVLLTETTLFKVGAYNNRDVSVAATNVWVTQKTVIDYDIGFVSAQTNVFYSLVKAENGSDTYGTVAGNRICLRWRVLHAAHVHILPFNITAHEGEHTFSTSTSLDISVTAHVDQQALTRKITLLAFPIPVFRDKLLSLASRTPLPTLTPDAVQMLTLTLRDSEKRYHNLVKKIHRYTFHQASKKPTLEKLNAFVFRYLKRMNAGKEGVRKTIESIEHYYER